MLVKVYDLIKVMREASGENLAGSEINALIVGDEFVILTDDEAVHTTHRKITGLKLTLPVNERQKQALVIEKTFRLPMDYLLNTAKPIKEVELGTFVRRFGTRIEANYYKLLLSISEIGLDPFNFPRDITKATTETYPMSNAERSSRGGFLQ